MLPGLWPVADTQMITGKGLAGVHIGDHAVAFRGEDIRADNAEFTLPGTRHARVLVCDMNMMVLVKTHIIVDQRTPRRES